MTDPTIDTVRKWANDHHLTTRVGSSGTSTYFMFDEVDILSYWYARDLLQVHITRDSGKGQPGGLDDFDAFKSLNARQALIVRLQNFKRLEQFERDSGQRDPVFAVSDFTSERELESYLNLYLLSIIEVLYRSIRWKT